MRCMAVLREVTCIRRYAEVLTTEVNVLFDKGLTQNVLRDINHWLAEFTELRGTQGADTVALIIKKLAEEVLSQRFRSRQTLFGGSNLNATRGFNFTS